MKWLVILISMGLAISCYSETVSSDGQSQDTNTSALCASDSVLELEGGIYTGVDILIVVDNSGSMSEEQSILATSVLGMINALTNPTTGWNFPAVEEMRVAVVSSDLGLQYGESGSTQGFPYTIDVQTCTDSTPKGDDGVFFNELLQNVQIMSGKIACQEGGVECPGDSSCQDGYCVSSSGDTFTVACPESSGGDWFETDQLSPNSELSIQTACLTGVGTQGCGVEQQLEAAVKGLYKPEQSGFVKEDHVLAVIVVSDENDCSVEDRGLFETDEWLSGTAYDEDDPASGLLNVACNYPAQNETDYLFDTARYAQRLLALKADECQAVLFFAIVGVPNAEGSPCQGPGDELSGCLESDEMQLDIATFADSNGNKYKHFATACVREENGVQVTQARPGRRYVEVAADLGPSGYVYSICNEDWTPAMENVAEDIAGRIFGNTQ